MFLFFVSSVQSQSSGDCGTITFSGCYTHSFTMVYQMPTQNPTASGTTAVQQVVEFGPSSNGVIPQWVGSVDTITCSGTTVASCDTFATTPADCGNSGFFQCESQSGNSAWPWGCPANGESQNSMAGALIKMNVAISPNATWLATASSDCQGMNATANVYGIFGPAGTCVQNLTENKACPMQTSPFTEGQTPSCSDQQMTTACASVSCTNGDVCYCNLNGNTPTGSCGPSLGTALGLVGTLLYVAIIVPIVIVLLIIACIVGCCMCGVCAATAASQNRGL